MTEKIALFSHKLAKKNDIATLPQNKITILPYI